MDHRVTVSRIPGASLEQAGDADLKWFRSIGASQCVLDWYRDNNPNDFAVFGVQYHSLQSIRGKTIADDQIEIAEDDDIGPVMLSYRDEDPVICLVDRCDRDHVVWQVTSLNRFWDQVCDGIDTAIEDGWSFDD